VTAAPEGGSPMPAIATDQRLSRTLTAVMIALGVFLAYAATVTFTAPRASTADDESLPNPMGGPARAAPGDAVGDLELAGLQIAGSEVHMGEVALGVTYVPAWTVVNPSGEAIGLTVGQPQVLEGCCPGPVYIDGYLVEPGRHVMVPPGGSVLVQFPLQMHAGMDGPHRLAVPLAADSATAALQVTGDFTATARP
jgi:hypothetical protein